MKISLVVVLVGLAIGFVVPAFAQQKDTVDPQITEQLKALSKKTDEAFNNGDAAALAPLYTEDAVLVNDTGPIYGREAIVKHWADDFKQGFHSSNNIATPDGDSPHIIGTAGNEMWATGKWSATIQGKGWGPVPATGYWSVIREGDDWKIRMLCFNVTPPPAAPAQTK